MELEEKKYNIGDRVRVIEGLGGRYNPPSFPHVGDIYVIYEYVRRSTYHLYRARRENNGPTWNFKENEITFVSTPLTEILYTYD